jgi:hypothetical protein
VRPSLSPLVPEQKGRGIPGTTELPIPEGLAGWPSRELRYWGRVELGKVHFGPCGVGIHGWVNFDVSEVPVGCVSHKVAYVGPRKGVINSLVALVCATAHEEEHPLTVSDSAGAGFGRE